MNKILLLEILRIRNSLILDKALQEDIVRPSILLPDSLRKDQAVAD